MPKRKRTNAKGRAAKRRKYTPKRGVKRRAFTPVGIKRPRYMPTLQERVKTTHVNKISMEISSATNLEFTPREEVHILPMRLRDPDPATRKQPFPENFTVMSNLYKRYRVNGVRIFASIHGLTNTEDEKFIFCVYSTSSSDGASDPWRGGTGVPVGVVVDRASRDAMLQFPGIRKKMIADSGTTGNRRNNVFNCGYFSMPGIEGVRRTDMADEFYAGRVTETGGAAADPVRTPRIWFRWLSPRYTGSNQQRDYTLNLTMKFDVEWFDRREAPEADQGEVDPA